MEQQTVSGEQVSVHATNIGGIDRTEVTFEPGVTILTGRNATHKTSLLQAIMAGLGSTNVSLKSDADNGSVTFEIGETTATVDISRQNGTVTFEGDPYQDDTELADLFAFLLGSNEARRTVELGGDLRDIVMRPVDTDAIQAEISRLQAEKAEITDQIESKSDLQSERSALKQRRDDLDDEIEQTRETLEQAREELADNSEEVAEARAENTEFDEKMEELQERRSDLDTVQFQIDSQQESLSSLREEREELLEAQEQLPADVSSEIDDIETEISQLRSQKQELEADLSSLQNVIQFNEEMLEGGNEEIAHALEDEGDTDAVTDQLLETEETVCWTCGTPVAQERIQETLDALRELRQGKYSTQQQVEDELAELTDKRSTLTQRQERRETVEQTLAEVTEEIERREAKRAELEAEQEELEATIDELETAVEQLEREDLSEVLELERTVNEREFELSRLEDNRDSVASQIEEIEAQIEEHATLEQRREEIAEQLTELRMRVDRIEEQAVSEFNAHMEAVLDILKYENLDRIWIDRVEETRREGRRTVTETVFQLHVVRSTDDGVAYEDEFENLSESEREVTALVFALAGYLVHDVHEEVPFILLDSLDAIDAQRIDALLEYLADYAAYLVVTLLPEDADAVDDSYQYISDI
jgi:DNA repair exonuclease SbcCD ATPase subunit